MTFHIVFHEWQGYRHKDYEVGGYFVLGWTTIYYFRKF